MPENPVGKTSWKSPEGRINAVTKFLWIGLAGLTGFLVLDKVLPLIIRVLAMGINAMLLLIPAAVLLIILTSPRFWLLLRYALRSLGRMFVGWFQDIDPIGILKNYVEDIQRKKARIERQVAIVKGVMHDLKETMEANARKREQELRLAGQAQKQQNPYMFKLKARRAGRLQDSNVTYGQLLAKLEVVYRVLERINDASGFIVEDTQDQVEELTKRKRAVNAAYGAMRDAWSIIKGGAAKELYDSTVLRLVEQLNQQVGEIDGFVDIAEAFIGSVDLQQGVYEEDALAKLLEWEKRVDSLVLGDDKKGLIASAELDANTAMGMGGQTQSPAKSRYLQQGGQGQ